MYRVEIEFNDTKYGYDLTPWHHEISTVPRIGDTISIPVGVAIGALIQSERFKDADAGDAEGDTATRAIVVSVAWNLDNLDKPASAEFGEPKWPQVIIGCTLQWESDQ